MSPVDSGINIASFLLASIYIPHPREFSWWLRHSHEDSGSRHVTSERVRHSRDMVRACQANRVCPPLFRNADAPFLDGRLEMLRLPTILVAFAIAIFSLVVATWLDIKFVASYASETTAATPVEDQPRFPVSKQAVQKALIQWTITQKLKPGTQAPPMTLLRADGSGQVELKELQGQKPLVLIFGSFTCNLFFDQVGELDQVHKQYKNHAEFCFVYISEAHPDQEITVQLEVGPTRMFFPVTESVTERLKRAELLERSTGMQIPAFAAVNEELLEETYGPWPSRFMIVDRNHHIVFNSGLERMEKDSVTNKLKRFLSEYLPFSRG
jgi:hypothetical protein